MKYQRLSDWTESLQRKGKYGFSLEEAYESLSLKSEISIKRSLNRLAEKGKILSIHKGYYLIIPPEYYEPGIPQPENFIDGLMAFLGRKYYLALTSAAALHGAGHQRAQEYFVATELPPMRPTVKKGIKINYLSKRKINYKFIEKIKTETGFINVSSSLLTACDLVQFENLIGGINRAILLLEEIFENSDEVKIPATLNDLVPVTVIQRLGFIIEFYLHNKNLADKIYGILDSGSRSVYRTPLKPGRACDDYDSANRWKVYPNIKTGGEL